MIIKNNHQRRGNKTCRILLRWIFYVKTKSNENTFQEIEIHPCTVGDDDTRFRVEKIIHQLGNLESNVASAADRRMDVTTAINKRKPETQNCFSGFIIQYL